MEYRLLTAIEELEAVHQLEEAIWENEIVPVHQTLTIVRNGGLMIGAYDGEQLVGFSYSFPGVKNGQTYLCSHMLGILESYRSKGIGKALKEKQKEFAKEAGYSLMTWTFDPLETRNARLNINKLGAISQTYIENCYGNLNDGLNQGLPTDRLEVAWHLDQKQDRNKFIANTKKEVPLNEVPTINEMTRLTVERFEKDSLYYFYLPDNMQHIKKTDPSLALKWRLHVRELFQTSFEKQFVFIDVEKMPTRVKYIFIHQSQL